jgi:hypothetical protein
MGCRNIVYLKDMERKWKRLERPCVVGFLYGFSLGSSLNKNNINILTFQFLLHIISYAHRPVEEEGSRHITKYFAMNYIIMCKLWVGIDKTSNTCS